MLAAHPILTCVEARALEDRLLGQDADLTWAAMRAAGAGVGAGVLRDFPQWRLLPRDPRVLVLAGAGHNGGDALLAAAEIIRARPRGKVTVVMLDTVENFKPLARRAWGTLTAQTKVEAFLSGQFLEQLNTGSRWDVTLDGLFGMSFKLPMREPARELIGALNATREAQGFRAAVDMPSGMSDQGGDIFYEADFTYATGIAKAPLFWTQNARWVGRIRYVDIGFFKTIYDGGRSHPENLLTEAVLEPLRQLRPTWADKRTHGHLLVVTGSKAYPGAQMLNVSGALRAGAGLVTALTPAGHAAAFAAARPEAMWRACAEESDGGHGAMTLAAARELWPRATAMVVGSGMGRGAATQSVIAALVAECPLPLVLDADALMPATLKALTKRPEKFGAVILTPHAGEFARLEGKEAELSRFCHEHRVITLLKGRISRLADANHTWCSTFGGPVLARGGSGDILAGMVGALLAQAPTEPFLAAARALVWHGLAADVLAHHRGETSALTAELATYLPEALRGE